jgi:hypothetical protein
VSIALGLAMIGLGLWIGLTVAKEARGGGLKIEGEYATEIIERSKRPIKFWFWTALISIAAVGMIVVGITLVVLQP